MHTLPHSHDFALALLSYVVAYLGSYTALDMGGRLVSAEGASRRLWLAATAIVLGGGIWSMHFVAMLAMNVDIPVSYDPGITVLSLLIAIAFTAVGFRLVARGAAPSPLRLLAAGVIVGMGVVAMHYSGMAAMRFAGTLRYDYWIVALSVLIAVVAATAALFLALNLTQTWHKLAAAAVMAAAICGMHYTGMAAVTVVVDAAVVDTSDSLARPLLALAVATSTFAILCIGLTIAFIDRRMEVLAEREAARLRVANARLSAEIAERQGVERQLREARDELEARVLERTRELAAANEKMRASAVDLEQARTRAEAANRAKSDFLASMSHELRTPLNSILGFAQLLTRTGAEKLSDRQARQVGLISKNGQHLLKLIEDVLDLSKIETGNIKLSIEPVTLPGVMDEVRSMLKPLAQRHEVVLTIDVPSSLDPVMVDRTRLVQVLINLGSNAIKYNRPGGDVRLIAVPWFDGQVRISVEDTGPGIPHILHSQIFEPFNRLGADQITRPGGPIEGTGIGLTITRRLVELMGGRIEFTSVVDVGTVFVVALPVAAGVQRPVEADAPRRAAGRLDGKRMLYVEDNPSNIELMRDLVDTIAGLELIVANQPSIGLDLARAHRFDVIVLDINLPGMSGVELLGHLRAMPETAGTPVLALSAAAMEREVQRGLAAGFRHYLTKPLDIPKFVAALEDVMDVRLEQAD
jgi:signal transduction histidine kinase/ActR/RegA family two-component response regulator